MLKKKYLASASIYVSHAHKKKIILRYLKECRKTFEKISILLENNKIKNIIDKKDLRSDAFTRL